MYNGKFVPSSRVIDKFYRDSGFDWQMQFSDLVEWIGDALASLRVPVVLVNKVTDGNGDLNHPDFIEINDFRGELPCDLYSVTQAAKVFEFEHQNEFDQCKFDCTNSLGNIVCLDNITGNQTAPCCNGCVEDLSESENNLNCPENIEKCIYIKYFPMMYSTDTFHVAADKHRHSCDAAWRCKSEFTYSLNGNYIFTNFKYGKVALSYRAIMTDNEGLPMIPDSSNAIEYVYWYLVEKVAFQLYLTDKLTADKYDRIQAMKQLFYEKSRNDGKMPKTLDEWQAYIRQRNRIIPVFDDHSRFFSTLNQAQARRIHPNRYTTGGSSSNILV